MRYLLALLLALAPLGASRAAVSVSANMGGNLGQVSCTSASSINYHLDTGVFAFYCADTSLTYSCTPDANGISYGTGTQTVTMNCATNTGSAKGLVVNAMVDGVQNGNGNSDGFCNNAGNFAFDLNAGKYSWTCNNGNSAPVVTCYTSQVISQFDLAANQVNMDCVTIFSRSGFEDFEPAATQ